MTMVSLGGADLSWNEYLGETVDRLPELVLMLCQA